MGPGYRVRTRETVMTWSDRCRKAFSGDVKVVCNRPRGHYGLHRQKVPKNRQALSWGDNECARQEA